jgi:hypothetical protein
VHQSTLDNPDPPPDPPASRDACDREVEQAGECWLIMLRYAVVLEVALLLLKLLLMSVGCGMPSEKERTDRIAPERVASLLLLVRALSLLLALWFTAGNFAGSSGGP